ncbi:MAG: hypothetical protein O2973_03795 [Gemmatimonadetes bacterium]|nr:hypothetical protein [Gemmatimonadota bacterium]
MVDAVGGAPRQLTNWSGYEQSTAWSPDGSAVYFYSDHDTKLGDIWKMDVSGGEPTRVTNNGTVNELAGRAGVADLFALVLNPAGGQFGISRVRPDGRMNVVWDRTNAVVASISPTGDSIAAIVEQSNGKLHSMILPAAGGAGRMILGPDEGPTSIGGAWSSDDKFLLYATTVNNVADLGMLTIADGTTRRLTTTPESEDGAEFTPDGKTVVFRRSATVQRLYRAVIP